MLDVSVLSLLYLLGAVRVLLKGGLCLYVLPFLRLELVQLFVLVLRDCYHISCRCGGCLWKMPIDVFCEVVGAGVVCVQ